MSIRIPAPINNKEGYSPLRDQEDPMLAAYSPRIHVPKMKSSTSLLTEAIRATSTSSEKMISGINSFEMSADFESYESTSETVNPLLLKKLHDRQQNVMMLEITSDGNGDYKLMSLRELLAYINNIATEIDNKYLHQFKLKSLKEMSSLNLASQVGAAAKGAQAQSGRITPATSSLQFIDDDKESTGNKDQKSMGAQYLRHRDLRRLEYNFNPLGEPSLFVRRHAVLLSLDPLRVVVMADR
jgi:hypothetical protein